MRLVPFNDMIPVWNGLESKVRLPFATVTLCGNRVLLIVIYRRDPSRNLRTPAGNLIASLACSGFITGCFVGYGRAIIEFSAYFETSVPKALHAILDLGGAESLAIMTRHTSNSCQDNRHLPAVLDGLRAAPPVLYQILGLDNVHSVRHMKCSTLESKPSPSRNFRLSQAKRTVEAFRIQNSPPHSAWLERNEDLPFIVLPSHLENMLLTYPYDKEGSKKENSGLCAGSSPVAL